MLGEPTSIDNLAKALADYKTDFEKRTKAAPNPDAAHAEKRIEQAEELVRRSGLGEALTDLLEHTKNWPSWSKHNNFQKMIGFPASKIIASEETDQEHQRRKTTTTFVYQGCRYGMIFKDGGSTMPNEHLHRGTVEFIADDETVLGLNISFDRLFIDWRWLQVHALKIGDWTKHLLEIAVHIKNESEAFSNKMSDDLIIDRAKNISL